MKKSIFYFKLEILSLYLYQLKIDNMSTVYTKQVISEHGELKETIVIKKVTTKEQFTRLYLQDIGALVKCSKAEQSVLFCLLQYVNYDSNMIIIDSGVRVRICQCADIKQNTLSIALSRLFKKNILIKIEKSMFLNPKLFFYGTDIDRAKMLNLTISYELTD